jgi:hypothetical protein
MPGVWTFVFRLSGLCLGMSAVIFLSVPSASTWKNVAGVACAAFGAICLVAMYFAKKVGGQEELHLVKSELEHYPPGTQGADKRLDIDDHD